jgi:arsenate reductase-like glutaredoxin family protein
MDRAATLALARGARRLLVKAGDGILRLDAGTRPLAEADVVKYLVHEDGFLRVPVLVLDDLLVRGYTEELYREALATRSSRSPA